MEEIIIVFNINGTYIVIPSYTRSKAFFRSRNTTPDISGLPMAVSQECVRRASTVLQEYITSKPRLKRMMEL